MKRFLPIFLLAVLSSCSEKIMSPSEEQLVVEGWIDAGGFPLVMVSTTVPASTEYQDFAALDRHIVTWATVTVSDGENSAVLTGLYDRHYLPYYVYSTTRLRGEAGKTYTLTVEYKDKIATAVTTVPEPLALDTVKVQEENGVYTILGCFTDPPQTQDYYKFFSKVEGEDDTYLSSFMGTVDDSVLDGYTEIPIYRGRSLTQTENASSQYHPGDLVRIKFCRMDETAYRYWDNYEKLTSLARSPLFPVHISMDTNVYGALGYWAGYGASFYTVEVR